MAEANTDVVNTFTADQKFEERVLVEGQGDVRPCIADLVRDGTGVGFNNLGHLLFFVGNEVKAQFSNFLHQIYARTLQVYGTLSVTQNDPVVAKSATIEILGEVDGRKLLIKVNGRLAELPFTWR